MGFRQNEIWRTGFGKIGHNQERHESQSSDSSHSLWLEATLLEVLLEPLAGLATGFRQPLNIQRDFHV